MKISVHRLAEISCTERDEQSQEKVKRWMIFCCLGVLVTILQSYLLYHLLVESKPYKIVDPSEVYRYTCAYGLPIAILIALGLTYLVRHRTTRFLLPLIPTLLFPILVWAVYNIFFITFGVDFFSGSGDFTVRQIELEFAHDLIEVLYLGSIGAIVAAGFGVCISKLFKLEDGRDRSVNLNID